MCRAHAWANLIVEIGLFVDWLVAAGAIPAKLGELVALQTLSLGGIG